MKKMEKLTIRISETLKEDIQNLAESDGRTVANYLCIVRQKRVEKEKAKRNT